MTEKIVGRDRTGNNPPVIRLAVGGARGRMGAKICALVRDDPRFALAAAIVRQDGEGCPDRDDRFDAVINFSPTTALGGGHDSRPAITPPCDVSTTGLSRQTLEAIDLVARSIPVMVVANTAPGVAVLQASGRRRGLAAR